VYVFVSALRYIAQMKFILTTLIMLRCHCDNVSNFIVALLIFQVIEDEAEAKETGGTDAVSEHSASQSYSGLNMSYKGKKEVLIRLKCIYKF
jgi:hypothetical protein